MDPINVKTGMTHAEVRKFIRSHFDEFVNKKNTVSLMEKLTGQERMVAELCWAIQKRTTDART